MAGVDRPGRVIGGRQTRQSRSYFALELPAIGGCGVGQPARGLHRPAAGRLFPICPSSGWSRTRSSSSASASPIGSMSIPRRREETKDALLPHPAGRGVQAGQGQEPPAQAGAERRQPSLCPLPGRRASTTSLAAAVAPSSTPRTISSISKDFVFDYPPPGIPYDTGEIALSAQLHHCREAGLRRGSALPNPFHLLVAHFREFPVCRSQLDVPAGLFFAYLLFIWMLDFNARVFGSTTAGATLPAGGLARASLRAASLTRWSPTGSWRSLRPGRSCSARRPSADTTILRTSRMAGAGCSWAGCISSPRPWSWRRSPASSFVPWATSGSVGRSPRQRPPRLWHRRRCSALICGSAWRC